MTKLHSIAVGAALLLGGIGTAKAEFPTFEVKGFPIMPHQVQVVGSAHVKEQSPTPRLTLAGMPASPHQVNVLMPRRITQQQIADNLVEAGFSRVRFVTPAEYTVMGMRNGGWVKLTIDSRTGQPRQRLLDTLLVPQKLPNPEE